MDVENITQLNQVVETLADKLGIATSQLIEYYTPWCMANALFCMFSWIAVSIACIVVSTWLRKESKPDNKDNMYISKTIYLASVLVGTLSVFFNLPSLLHPEAAAISKILSLMSTI